MASWNENYSNDGYSYFDDPCPYCGRPHWWKNCQNIPGADLCAQSQSFEWNICNMCGGQDDHWDGCPNPVHPSLSPYYDLSNDVSEFDRGNEVQDMEPDAYIRNILRQVAEQQDELKKDMKRMRAAITRMKANMEELNEESEYQQTDNFEKVEILSHMSLVEQSERLEIYEAQREEITNEMRYFIEGRAKLGQEIDKFGTTIHDLEAQLNTKVDASNAQQNSNELCKAENELIRQIKKLKVESQSLENIFVDDAHVEKSTLEPCEEVDNVIFEDSCVCKYEDVKSNTILELGRIGPHSNHFSTLCLDSKIVIKTSEPMGESKSEDESACILEFVMPKSKKYIPHLKAEKCRVKNLLLGLVIIVAPPLEHSRKLDAMLGAQFISSRWRQKVIHVVPLR